MATLILPLDVRDDYAISVTYTLERVDVTLRLRWRARAAGWYCDVIDSTGVVRSSGRRVCTGSPLLADRTWPTLPPGQIVAVGTVDLTRREYLGTVVQLAYVESADLS